MVVTSDMYEGGVWNDLWFIFAPILCEYYLKYNNDKCLIPLTPLTTISAIVAATSQDNVSNTSSEHLAHITMGIATTNNDGSTQRGQMGHFELIILSDMFIHLNTPPRVPRFRNTWMLGIPCTQKPDWILSSHEIKTKIWLWEMLRSDVWLTAASGVIKYHPTGVMTC